ncbi:M1 family metallopeptidase [candidate division CSSED10-310 bacterium]|uniref:M1 family metallopeptidase n=1 Tax=candidate division CSSED10-310 bacterium TaxID=2855610 RepID=A0ABV6YTT6_UNCC1
MKQRMVMGYFCPCCFLFFILSGWVSGSDLERSERLRAEDAIKEYDHLLQYKFSKEPLSVPPAGITLTRDSATWILESGEIRLMEPTSQGVITGLLFKGRGRFRMAIPDPIEIKQLQRYTDDPALTELDEQFSELILRTSGDFVPTLVSPGPKDTYTTNKYARKHHEHWLKDVFYDVNARIISGLLNHDHEFLCVDMNTESYDWLRYDFENQRLEEIQLKKLQSRFNYKEIWVSLDRVEDRQADGRPSAVCRDPIDITHVEFLIDLTHRSKERYRERLRKIAVNGKFKAKITFNPLIPGQQALNLELHPRAKINSVVTGEGVELVFIRDQIGKRFQSLKKETYDSSMVVIFNEPLTSEPTQIEFDYELDIFGYVSGRLWYPGLLTGLNDVHTAKLTVTLPAKQDIRSVGICEQEQITKKLKKSIWNIDFPTKMIGFTCGKGFREEKVKLEGVPEVISFGEARGFTLGDTVKKVAEDVARSIEFYQQFFNMNLPMKTIYATKIFGWHGQSFHGFIYLSELTFKREHPGATELFRAHEAAHQFWGHVVGWKTYRDMWLSESFAEYSAMMFIEHSMAADNFFEEILAVYSNEILGSIKSAMSKFARPWNIQMHPRERRSIGPVGLGYRASSALVPQGTFIQTYHKGPLVLHMLRVLLRNKFGTDETFRNILADFLRTYKDKDVTTAEFITIVEKHTAMEWQWFFDQWVFDTAIPTYHWNYIIREPSPDQSDYELQIKVIQSEVPPDFKMEVPLRVTYKQGQEEKFILRINATAEDWNLTLPQKPKKVTLNPDYAVLAKVIKDSAINFTP